MMAITRQPTDLSQSMERMAVSSVIPLTLLLKAQQ